MSNTIPKSLHTVRVLVEMARLAWESKPLSPNEAVEFAAARLGYADTADAYGLKAKALKQLEGSI